MYLHCRMDLWWGWFKQLFGWWRVEFEHSFSKNSYQGGCRPKRWKDEKISYCIFSCVSWSHVCSISHTSYFMYSVVFCWMLFCHSGCGSPSTPVSHLLAVILMILLCFIFQELFEKLFSPYGSKNDRSFIYLRTFHRVRVTFDNEEKAREAKKDLHGQLFLGYELGVFFVQVITKFLLLMLFFFTCFWLLPFFREGAVPNFVHHDFWAG